jgi:hypothetical protein
MSLDAGKYIKLIYPIVAKRDDSDQSRLVKGAPNFARREYSLPKIQSIFLRRRISPKLDKSHRLQLDGIVAKKADAIYDPGNPLNH